MLKEKIELRQKRDIGDITTVYFDFLKQNFKNYSNIFIGYNGIFILAFLGVSYLLVTGFMGIANSGSDDITSAMYLGFGGLAFLLVFVMVAALNYSLSSNYISLYVTGNTINVEKTHVWEQVKNNIGNIIIFILLMFVIYIGYLVVSVILAIIPVIGTIIQYILNFGMTSWLGISFMVMLHEKKGVSESFGEGRQLVTKNFWKCVGVNFILGLLIGILLLLILTIPGILIGAYAFHAVDSGVDMTNSVVAKVIWIIALWVLLIAATYSQALSQFINGILYFSLHEQTYNDHTRSKIEQIGSDH